MVTPAGTVNVPDAVKTWPPGADGVTISRHDETPSPRSVNTDCAASAVALAPLGQAVSLPVVTMVTVFDVVSVRTYSNGSGMPAALAAKGRVMVIFPEAALTSTSPALSAVSVVLAL